MRASVGSHPTEGTVEDYVLERLKGPELEEFEVHLLICERCQARVAEEDEFRADVKQAATTLQRKDPIPIRSRPAVRRLPVFDWFSKPVWIGAVAAVTLAVAIWIPRDRMAPAHAEVFLRVTRGPEAGLIPAPAGKPFTMKADMAGVPPAAGYRLAIADASGRVVVTREVVRQGDVVEVRIPSGLPVGHYWVRLLGDGERLFREYALESR
jgi:anti-sigma factor RsiW